MKVQSALLICATGVLALNALPIKPTSAHDELLVARVSTEPSSLPAFERLAGRKRSSSSERGIPFDIFDKRNKEEDDLRKRFAPMRYPIAPLLVRREPEEGGGGGHPAPPIADTKTEGADSAPDAEDKTKDADAHVAGDDAKPKATKDADAHVAGDDAKPKAEGKADAEGQAEGSHPKASTAGAEGDGEAKEADTEKPKNADHGASKPKDGEKDCDEKKEEKEKGKEGEKKDEDDKDDDKDKDKDGAQASLPKGVTASSSGFLFLPVTGAQAAQGAGESKEGTSPSAAAAAPPQRNTYFINIESPANGLSPSQIQPLVKKPETHDAKAPKKSSPAPEVPPEAAKGQTRIVFKPLTDPEKSASAPGAKDGAGGGPNAKGEHDYFLFPVSQPNEKVDLNKGDLIAYVDNPQRAAAAAASGGGGGGGESGGAEAGRPASVSSPPTTDFPPPHRRATLTGEQEPGASRRGSRSKRSDESVRRSEAVGHYIKRSLFNGSPYARPQYWHGQKY